MPFSVRRASAGDAGALADLRWTWRAGERGEKGLRQPEFVARFGEWVGEHEGTHAAFLAERDGAAVGMAWLAVYERIPGPGRWERRAGNLQSVYVLPAHRDRGIGADLVRAVLDEARTRALDYVVVHPSERSFPFYRRLGFDDRGNALEIDLRPTPPG